MNILITGGAGGIGSTLCIELAKNGHTVVALDDFSHGYMENLFDNGKQVCDAVPLDIRKTKRLTKLLQFNKTDVIVHLAALTSLPECESNPAECLSVNVAGTASVLKAAKDAGVKRTIVASTSAIYEGNTEAEAPFPETIQVKPSLFYPLSKKLMEDVVQSYIANYGMDIVTLRFFNVFGPRQDVHRPSPPLLNYIVKQVVKKEPCTFYSTGEQKRDYVHVDDVVKLIELCVNRSTAKGQTYNVCTGTLTSVKDVIDSAVTAFGDLKYEFRPSKEYWSSYKLSISKDAVEREVNKFSLGSCTKAMWELSWKPNKNIQYLMTETMKQNYELITR